MTVGSGDGEPRIPSPEPRAWDDMVLVGRIARPQGLRGHVFVNPETDFVDERFVAGAVLWTNSERGVEALTLAAARLQNGRPVVAFEGVTSIEAVERLVGRELRVPADSLPQLDRGTYYHHQLVGCEVEATTGERVGTVARVDGGIGGTLLTITGPRGEVLVPFATDICVDVDVEQRRIRIEAPPGLLELNESGPPRVGPHRRERPPRRPST
jgi:16S rRNA processing protein RimM